MDGMPRDDDGTRDPAEMKAVISREWHCSSFRKWTLGFTPKEHVEMHLFEEQKKREDQRDAANHRWRIGELLLIGFLAPAGSMAMQYFTTRMQIDSTVRNAVKEHHEERSRSPLPTTNPPAQSTQPASAIAPTNP
jgi:hypothetical protein